MMSLNRDYRFLIPTVLLTAVLCPAARAQAPQETAIFPAAAQAGTTATVTVTGANLQGATGLHITGAGVTGKITKNTEAGSLPIELTIAKDAAPGTREIRVVTPRGVSNARPVLVDQHPCLNEVEPNNVPAQAQAVAKFPATINGQANGAEDVDFFAFEAAAGDTWVFDLNGGRHRSAVAGFISIRDEKGRDLKTAMEATEQDPRLVYTFKKPGRYYLQVRDKLYRGGVNFTYAVSAGKLPTVLATMPLGGKRGEAVDVALEGVNLGDMKTVKVTMPADPALSAITFVPPTAGGPANPIQLFVGDFAEAAETEPNENTSQATKIPALPVTVNGRIGKDGDVDTFTFTGTDKQQLVFDLHGRRLKSRLDSVIRILDKMGKELTSNDDAAGKDSRLSFTLPAAGEYFVEVKSLDTHGGPDHFYRLQIMPPPVDFALTVTPDNPNIGPNGSVALIVNCVRSGYGGEITLQAEGLPAGVTASHATLRPGQNQTLMTLTAAADAAIALAPIKIKGTATIDSKPVVRTAAAGEATPAVEGQQPGFKPVESHVAAVTEQQQFALQVEPREIKITQGQNVEITVKAVRKMGFDAAINIAALNNLLPAGVTLQAKPIPDKQTEVKFNVVAAANAAEVTQNLVLTGTAANVVQASPALAVTVVKK